MWQAAAFVCYELKSAITSAKHEGSNLDMFPQRYKYETLTSEGKLILSGGEDPGAGQFELPGAAYSNSVLDLSLPI